MARQFDRYDERMLPMFAALAREATERGYCSEYDSLAAIVGAPSREEIKRLNAPPLPEQDGFYVATEQVYQVDVPGPSIRFWKRLGGQWYRVLTGNSGGVTHETPDEPVTRLIAATEGSS